jgi:Protein of unknown function (DUF3467)
MTEGSEKLAAVIEARYANHFQVGHNEYEFIFDFRQFHPGQINFAGGSTQVPLVRIVMGPPFAKALLETLRRAVGEYERSHGAIVQG